MDSVMVQAAWDEPTYSKVGIAICNKCGAEFSNVDDAIYHDATAPNCGYGYHIESRNVQTGSIHHDAVYENRWVETKPAWTETVVTGQRCTGCGATK